MLTIFTRKKEGNQYEIRKFGREYLITREEALRLIETEQAYYKANKPIRSLKELDSRIVG